MHYYLDDQQALQATIDMPFLEEDDGVQTYWLDVDEKDSDAGVVICVESIVTNKLNTGEWRFKGDTEELPGSCKHLKSLNAMAVVFALRHGIEASYSNNRCKMTFREREGRDRNAIMTLAELAKNLGLQPRPRNKADWDGYRGFLDVLNDFKPVRPEPTEVVRVGF